jgi:hypothetical protein
MISITECLALGGKDIGTLILTGVPGRYVLTGDPVTETGDPMVLATGDAGQIQAALNLCLSAHVDNYSIPTYGSDQS